MKNRNIFSILKKTLIAFLSAIFITGCSYNLWSGSDGVNSNSSSPSETIYLNVTFQNDDGLIYFAETVEKGGLVSRPENPTKINHDFINWYSNGTTHNFFQPIYYSVNIIARFKLNQNIAKQTIQNNQLKANVMVKVKHYNLTFLNLFETDVVYTQGSGVIFDETETSYWLLTNNHVVAPEGRTYRSYTIYDYKSNNYVGKVYKGSESKYYDLAAMYFAKGKEKLKPISLAKKNPEVNREVVAIGQPSGQMNTITFGKIYSYLFGNVYEGEEIFWSPEFAFISHSANIYPGSSGGALLNHLLELIGINAAGNDEGSNLSIPIEQVYIFLNTYVYKS